MTPRNKMASVQNCLSAAKYLKMATPIFVGYGICTMTVHSEMFEILSVKGTQINYNPKRHL